MTFIRKFKNNGKGTDRSLELYLREIGTTPLISQEEEVRLAKQIKRGNKHALEALAKANLRFVVSIAKQYRNQGLSLGELIDEGNIGLLKAAKRFDETRGFKFVTYAVWWIRQAILQALAAQSKIVSLPLNRVGTLHTIDKAASSLEQDLGREPSPDEIAEELGLSEKAVVNHLRLGNMPMSLDASFSDSEDNSLMDMLEDESQPSPDESMLDAALKEEIEKALESLAPREAEVVTLYFGLNHEKALTLEEIGTRYSLTRERVRQIKVKAIRRLRHASRSRSLRAFLS